LIDEDAFRRLVTTMKNSYVEGPNPNYIVAKTIS
jgi:hypothetical protein